MRTIAAALGCLLLSATFALGEDGPTSGPSPEAIRAAAGRAIAPMEKAIRGHSAQRDCFSCHHHGMGTIVFTLARRRGFKVDAAELGEDVDLAENQLRQGATVLKQGRPIGGGVTTVGYALMSMGLGDRRPNDTTDAAVAFLLKSVKGGDHWQAASTRVPSEGSAYTATFLAVRGLREFGRPADRQRIDELSKGVRAWLAKNQGADTEDRVFRLRGLAAAGADRAEIDAAVAGLLKAQRPDGGWAQLDTGLDSDAYATGTALFALADAGGLPTTDPAYRRGIEFLLKTQKSDGTWRVQTRTKVIVQKYFESGFPHEKDQFISIAATGWSAAALLLALPAEVATEK